MTARESRCPSCRKAVPSRDGNPAWPFCSDRCRLLDLGRWLGEEFRIPGPRAGDGGAGPVPPEEDSR
jgi:uncharacterized protein